MENMKKYEEKQIELIEEYTSVLEQWFEDKDDSHFKRLTEIKELLDHITFGIQFNMVLEQVAMRKSGIVIPQQNMNIKM